MIQHATWRVDVVDGVQAATDSRGAAPLVHSEWVRLLLGGFLAPARLCGTPEAPRVEYLVSGCDDVEDVPEAVRESMRAAVASDLACLRAALADHRARIRDAADQPDRFDAVLFLDAYELLMATTVSDDPKHWVLTDEGLCITCWGLAEGPRQRPLLTWSDAEVDRMQAEIEHRLGRLPPASAPDLGPTARPPTPSGCVSKSPCAGRSLKPRGLKHPSVPPYLQHLGIKAFPTPRRK